MHFKSYNAEAISWLTRQSTQTWKSMIAPSLNIEGCKVHARLPYIGLFKEVVNHFRGHHPVHWHHGGHDDASDQVIQLTLEEQGRIVEDLPQWDFSCSLAPLIPTSSCLILSEQGHVWSDQAVAESGEVLYSSYIPNKSQT